MTRRLWTSLIGVVLIVLAHLTVQPLLGRIGIDEGFRELTVGYVLAIVPGAPAIFAFLALRFTTEGIGHTRPIMYTSLFSLVCNVFLNYVLMFGHFGAPALGAVGCGLASAITMWLLMFVLAADRQQPKTDVLYYLGGGHRTVDVESTPTVP